MECNDKRLKHFKLPLIRTKIDLFNALEFDNYDKQKYLNFTFRRKNNPYKTFDLYKRNGAIRKILIPDQRLKNIQKCLSLTIFNRIKLNSFCCGFVRGKSLLDNARPHLECKTLFKFDIENFFESINLTQIIKQLVWFGYSSDVSIAIGSLVVDNDYKLPQGAPSSPFISNIVANKLDYRIDHFCKKTFQRFGLSFTRYADDITISTKLNLSKNNCIYIFKKIIFIIKSENFKPNKQKCKIYKNGQRLTVTGVIVNSNIPAINKKIERKIENAIRYTEKYGIISHYTKISRNINPSKHQIDKYIQRVFGLLSFYNMVNPNKSRFLFNKWRKLTGVL